VSLGKEIMQMRARLSELKNRDKKIERQAAIHFTALREIIDPFLFDQDYSKIETDRAKVHIEELHRLTEEGRKGREQINQIERDLDG
jgi:hypothetical protein